MKFFFLLNCLVFCLELSEAFFLFPEKHAIFLCLKVCPLYCSKRQKRDASSYWEDAETYEWPPTSIEEDDHYYSYHGHPHPYFEGRYIYPCRPPTTTKKPSTTTKPTTTEEPTWICEVCQKKCGLPKS